MSISALRLVCLVFCCLLVLPGGLHLYHHVKGQQIVVSDNRKLADWPAAELLQTSVVEYTQQLSLHLQDHVGLREQALQLYAKARYRVLGLAASSKVVIGQQGWLFFAGERAPRFATKAPTMTLQQADQWLTVVAEVKQAVEAYGGTFLTVIVPDKARVYPEYLPKSTNSEHAVRAADTLAARARQLDFPLVDLHQALLAEKHRGLLYFKSDTHWQHAGAFVAYREILKQLNAQGRSAPTIGWHELETVGSVGMAGDLAKMLNLQDEFREQIDVVKRPSKSAATAEQSVVLKPTLLLVGDSFSAHMKEFLPVSFTEIRFKHHAFGKIPLAYIKQQQADVVVFEMIERALTNPLSVEQ